MNWSYAYTPNIWPSIGVTLLLFGLFIYSWQKREIPGALPLAIAILSATIWVGASALQIAAFDAPTQIFWYKVQVLFQLPSITAIVGFLLEFVWPGRFLTRRNLILLTLPIILLWGGALTNPIHQLSWRGFTYDGTIVAPIRGPLNGLLIAYAMGLASINVFIIAWLFVRSPQNRWLAFLMLLSVIATRTIYLLVASGRIKAILPINALVNVIPFIVYAIALFRFRILDPIPLARQMAMDQIEAGMLILDPQGRITSVNPAGAAILGEPARKLIGLQVQRLVPDCAGLILDLPVTGTKRIEVRMGASSKIRYYRLECSTLNDWRGLVVGRLLLLQDITEQKQAQQQIVEQQRALATLVERERLARELHDTVGQVLGYVSMQTQAIRKRAQDGDMLAVEAQLSRLAETTRAAHADVRESILSLHTGVNENWSLQEALQQYLDSFQENYGIQTDLCLPDGIGDGWLEPEAKVQLLRVVQEATNNARKHGQASCVKVRFISQNGGIQVLITDDGRGFDPELIQEGEPGHFGLRFMRERSESLGGRLYMESSLGEGTKVILEIPALSKQ